MSHTPGLPQLGTLGAGNHYAEIQVVDEIYNKQAAKRMGIDEPGQVCVMIHCGSRGLGHQVSIRLSTCLSVCLPVCMSACMSVCMSVCLCMFLCEISVFICPDLYVCLV